MFLLPRFRDGPVLRWAPALAWLLGNLVILGLLLRWPGLTPRTRGLAMGMAHAQFIPLLAWLALGKLRTSWRLCGALLLAGLVYLELVIGGLPYAGGRLPRADAVIAGGLFLLAGGLVVSAPLFLFRYAGWCLGVPGVQPADPPRRRGFRWLAGHVAGTAVTVAAVLSVARLLLLVAGYEEELTRLWERLPRLLPETSIMAALASAVAVPLVWGAFSRRRWPAWVVGASMSAAVVVLYLTVTSDRRWMSTAWAVVGGGGYLLAFFWIARAAGLRFVAAQGTVPGRGLEPADSERNRASGSRLGRFQYSLRTWLLGIFVVTIPLAWCAFVLRQQERTVHLSEKWRAAGAVAVVEDGHVISLQVDAERLPAESLRDLSRLRRLKTLAVRHWTDEMLDHLIDLDRLESLTLRDSALSGAGLVKLRQLDSLRSLSVTKGPGDATLPPTNKRPSAPSPSRGKSVLHDADVAGLCECERLEFLDLKDSALTVSGALRVIRQLPRLRTFTFPAGELKTPALVVRGVLSAEDIGQLVEIPQIESLQAEFSREAIRHIGQAMQLQALTASGGEITDSSLSSLHSLPKLARLDVSRTQVTPAGALASIPQLPALVSLRFLQGEFRPDRGGKGCEIELTGELPEPVFEHLGRLTNCTQLNLKNASFPPRASEHLRRLEALREVRLDGSSVSDDDLRSLAALPELARLDVPQTEVTLAAVVEFARQRRTTRIGLSSPPGELLGSTFHLKQELTAAELKRLSRLPKLECVRVELTSMIVGHTALPPLSRPEPPREPDASAVDDVLRMPHLEELRVHCVDGAKPALAALAGNDRITTIGLQGAVLQRDDLAELARFPQLTTLDLSQCSLGPGTLALVGQIEALKSLGLSFSQVDEGQWACLRTLARLQSLDLTACQLTDAGLGHLERLVQLRQLRLNFVRGITEPGIEKLQQALPQCKIERERR